MNEEEKRQIEAFLQDIGRKRRAQAHALTILQDIIKRNEEVDDLASVLFALRDALNLLLRDMPLGKLPED